MRSAKTTRRPAKSSADQAKMDAVAKPYFNLAIWFGLLLSVCVLYSAAGYFSFTNFDDPIYVTKNADVRAGLTSHSILSAMTAVVDTNWIPVTMLSHIATSEFFGMKSGWHHWVNVIFHFLGAGLLFAFLKRATHAAWPSAFVAFVFALHPLHVESVAWVTERKDVLSAFFWFLGLYAYLRYVDKPSIARYSMVNLAFCLGLMSKPMLVTFPFTLLLLDVWPLRRVNLPRTLLEKVPLFGLSAVSSVVTYLVQRSGGVIQSTTFWQNVENALVSYVGYIGQTFWPTDLAPMYPRREWLMWWQAALALAVILGISALVVAAWRTRPYLATGWFWYLGTLVPVIGLVQAGVQSHADRYMYVPMTGLAIMLAWGAADVVRRWPRAKSWMATAAVVSCVACLVVASAQADYWRDSETLYHRAIAVNSNNELAHYNLGEYLMQTPGRDSEAIREFETVLRINPRSSDTHNILGAYLLQKGRDAEAVPHFESALGIDPNSVAAHFNLALILEKDADRFQEAIPHYRAAMKSQPEWTFVRQRLGMLLMKAGRSAEALDEFEAAQHLQPTKEVEEIMFKLKKVVKR